MQVYGRGMSRDECRVPIWIRGGSLTIPRSKKIMLQKGVQRMLALVRGSFLLKRQDIHAWRLFYHFEEQPKYAAGWGAWKAKTCAFFPLVSWNVVDFRLEDGAARLCNIVHWRKCLPWCFVHHQCPQWDKDAGVWVHRTCLWLCKKRECACDL